MITLRQKMLRKYGGHATHSVVVESVNAAFDQLNELQQFAKRTATLKKALGECYCDDCWKDKVKRFGLGEFVTAEGKLPKRISKLVFEKTGGKLSPEESTELSDICSRLGKVNGNKPVKTYLVHLSRHIWWENGLMNDQGSCYWTYNAHHRETISNSPDTLALTLLREVATVPGPLKALEHRRPLLNLTKYAGVGRAFLFFEAEREIMSWNGCYGPAYAEMDRIMLAMLPDGFKHTATLGRGSVDYGDTNLYGTGTGVFHAPNVAAPFRVTPRLVEEKADEGDEDNE